MRVSLHQLIHDLTPHAPPGWTDEMACAHLRDSEDVWPLFAIWLLRVQAPSEHGERVAALYDRVLRGEAVTGQEWRAIAATASPPPPLAAAAYYYAYYTYYASSSAYASSSSAAAYCASANAYAYASFAAAAARRAQANKLLALMQGQWP